jgi:hypothetical protein
MNKAPISSSYPSKKYIVSILDSYTEHHTNSVIKGQTELTRLGILLRALQCFLSPQIAETK